MLTMDLILQGKWKLLAKRPGKVNLRYQCLKTRAKKLFINSKFSENCLAVA